MPEGDSIFRAARTLHRALAGSRIVRFESVFPSLTRVDEDRPIAGRQIESVAARGKHLLMTLSGGLVLHTHMRMNGSWHLYRPGERWRRPARDMRILLETEAFVAVGFNIPVAELVSSGALARHRDLAALGPDLLAPSFDNDEALRRLKGHAAAPIGEALLNQRVVAGIGNVYKSEILFVAGVDPFTRVADLSPDAIAAILGQARALMLANVDDRTSSTLPGRRTTRSLNPNVKLWVYGRAGKPCRKCGTPIRVRKSGLDARATYWCARCQRSSASSPAEAGRSARRRLRGELKS
jgi:endonuclease-8